MENTLKTDWLELETFTENLKKNGLMDGKIGSALFYLILSENDKKREDGDRALEILFAAFTDVFEADNALNFSFGYGISGLAYIVHKFKSNLLIRDSIDDGFLSEIDRLILNIIPFQVDSHNLGFMNGAAGNLYYLISRSRELTQYRHAIQEIIKKLYNNAIKDEEGVRFESGSLHSDLKMVGFERHFNLSLSDGMAGILNVLLHAYTIYPEIPHLRELIEEGIKFILGLERDVCIEQKRICFYPTVVSRDKKKRDEKIEFYNSRLGWCIGDLTISLLLCRAGKLLEEPKWLDQGNKVAVFTLQRRSMEFTKIDNAGLCHGACGVAAVYKRLSELTGNEILLKDGYEFWMSKADSGEFNNDRLDWDLLNGKLGITLSKLERFGQISPESWRDLFLL